jgi:uncharacterized membrane protein YvlD (DUF360 family)
VLIWGVYAVSLALVCLLLPGIWIDTSVAHWWLSGILLPVEFALLLLFLRPLLVLATLPLNAVTLGLPTLLFNGLLLHLMSWLDPALNIDGLGYAYLGLLILTVVSTAMTGWLGIDEVHPFFQTILRRVALRYGPRARPGQQRGLLLLQVDGLSWRALQRAVRRGRMPTVSSLTGSGSHDLYRWRSGVPSNTPPVQGGLFYGERRWLPGYRWYDRARGRVMVASRADDLRTAEADTAAHTGPGLLAGGSCINSLLGGGADKRLLTLTALREPSDARRPGERADFSLFWLNPHAYTTAVLATAWDFLTALFWHVQSRFHPRKKLVGRSLRTAAMRAVGNAFLRETAFFWLEQDVARGVPVIYSNFVGYDEVAHHAGPESNEALATLTAFDRRLQRLRRLLLRGAPVAYDLVLLSDHGQSQCLPFQHLYGETLDDLVGRLAGHVLPVLPPRETEAAYLGALLAELNEGGPKQPRRSGGLTRRTLARLRDEEPVRAGDAGIERHSLLVCVSGGLAHIYREGAERPLRLVEIRSLYPGLIEGLVGHPGIGFLLGRDEQGDPLMIAAGGVRNLRTGALYGEADPLLRFGTERDWAPELRALLGGEHAGDLIVNGAALSGRRIVAFEEQLGSHGGLGGPQTAPFLLVPSSLPVERADLRSPESLHALLRRCLRGD